MKISILSIGEEKPDFVSRCIQKQLGTDFSHSAILVDDLWVWHATKKGFHMAPLHTVLPGHIIRDKVDFELHGEDAAYARGWLDGHMDQEYSQSQLLGFRYTWLRPLLDNDNSKTICSEAVAMFMFQCLKIKDPRLFNCDWCHPRDVKEIANAARSSGRV